MARYYLQRNAKPCHAVAKTLVGPALKGVQERRDSIWIYNFINGSQSMIESGDLVASELFEKYNQIIMPDQNLNYEEVDAILQYIKIESDAIINQNVGNLRPAAYWEKNKSRPMKFTDYAFWIPFTLSVVILILILSYCVQIEDIKRDL